MVHSLRKLELLLKKARGWGHLFAGSQTVDMGSGKTLLLKEPGSFVSGVCVCRRAYVAGMGTWGKALVVQELLQKGSGNLYRVYMGLLRPWD